MKCLVLRHVEFEDLGLLEPALRRRGCEIEWVQVGVQALSGQDWVGADLVVVLGGPIGLGDLSLYPCLDDELAVIRQRLASRRPLLGICLGAQLIAAALQAPVRPGPAKEIGWAPVALSAAGARSPLRHLAGMEVLHWHGDQFDLPRGATPLASTALTPHQAFSLGPAVLAMQFHPEVDASKIEAWLIGHTAELRQAGVDIAALRAASAAQAREAQALAMENLLNDWLDA